MAAFVAAVVAVYVWRNRFRSDDDLHTGNNNHHHNHNHNGQPQQMASSIVVPGGGDEVSTLGDPVYPPGMGFRQDSDSLTATYDYVHAYGGTAAADANSRGSASGWKMVVMRVCWSNRSVRPLISASTAVYLAYYLSTVCRLCPGVTWRRHIHQPTSPTRGQL